MSPRVLWNSPSVPDLLIDGDFLPWDVRTKVDQLSAEDEPSNNDVTSLLRRYNSSSPSERDAIDAAFVWLTGYTFATICAMVVTPNGKDYERTLEKWRKAGS